MDNIIIKIPLTRGLFALIDEEDFEKVSPYKWLATKAGTHTTSSYAVTHVFNWDIRKMEPLAMHNLIGGKYEGLLWDHRDRNGLNNVRSNLRLVTVAENMMNKGPYGGCLSRFKGVNRTRHGTWCATIKPYGKSMYLGSYSKEEDAAKAYNEAAKKHFGDFAWLNPV